MAKDVVLEADSLSLTSVSSCSSCHPTATSPAQTGWRKSWLGLSPVREEVAPRQPLLGFPARGPSGLHAACAWACFALGQAMPGHHPPAIVPDFQSNSCNPAAYRKGRLLDISLEMMGLDFCPHSKPSLSQTQGFVLFCELPWALNSISDTMTSAHFSPHGRPAARQQKAVSPV